MALRQIDHISKDILLTSLILFFVIGSSLFIGDIFGVRCTIIIKVFLLFSFCFSVADYFRHLLANAISPPKKINSERKAVLITGCDSGFGHATAIRLYKKGFHVFAGCLNPLGDGAIQLERESSNEIQVFKLDVTSLADVSAAKSYVQESLNELELWAIINNAGIIKGLSTELTSIENFQQVLDVNLLGVIRVCKTFLPLLRSCNGRVVTVTSGTARVPWPCFVPYTLSKQAATAFCDLLRLEMNKWGVSVITVEPGLYRTNLTATMDKTYENDWSASQDDLKVAYGQNFIQNVTSSNRNIFQWLSDSNIDAVVDAIEAAVMDKNPQYAYRPAKWILRLSIIIMINLPKPIQDWLLCNLVCRNYLL